MDTCFAFFSFFITQIQHANTSFDLQLALRYTLCAAADRLRGNHMRYMLLIPIQD